MALDIFRLLEKDHREVKALMERAAGDAGVPERKALLARIKRELMAHTQAEEQEFYALLELAQHTAGEIDRAYEEHETALELLEQLSTLDPGDDRWREAIGRLRESVEQHIEEEENAVFPKARTLVGTQAEEIGRRFEASKRQITEMDAAAHSAQGNGGSNGSDSDDLAEMTRDALYDRARELGIDGRSKMTKRELVEAVRTRS